MRSWGAPPPGPRGLALATLITVVLVIACTETPQRAAPPRDVEAGPKLARDAGAILLQFAAYDYGLAGALSGAKTRTVTPARYGVVARAAAKTISSYNVSIVGAAVDRAGPIREKLVTVADGLTDLGRDAQAYADGGDPAAFARVLTGVSAGWQRVRELSTTLPRDDVLESTIARGTSFVVTATAATKFVVTAGPYSSVGEAEQALRTIGSPQNGSVTRTTPFVVRVTGYADGPAADLAVAAFAKQGVVGLSSQEQSYAFARSGPVPDAELWREPSRVIESVTGARRLALSEDGGWVATGSDSGQAALFDPAGTLRALPQAFAGLSALALSDDAKFLALGGQTLTFLTVPGGQFVGFPMRFNNAATQLLFVQGSRLFVATSKGPTGEPGGGPGVIGGRAPDGALLGDPFPIVTPAAGSQLAASDAGDVYVGTTSGGGYDVEVFRPGRDDSLRAVARVPGIGRAVAVDRAGRTVAAITDQGTYWVSIADAKTVKRLASPVREIAFAPDGTLYVLDQTSLVAFAPDGLRRWTVTLTDGRRLAVGRRPVVLDGTDRVVVLAPADGAIDELGVGGTVQDLVVSRDGKTAGVVVDSRRAVLFTLP